LNDIRQKWRICSGSGSLTEKYHIGVNKYLIKQNLVGILVFAVNSSDAKPMSGRKLVLSFNLPMLDALAAFSLK